LWGLAVDPSDPGAVLVSAVPDPTSRTRHRESVAASKAPACLAAWN